jgi:hypothetical protein
MQIFEFRDAVVGEYIESFISIADPRIRQTVDRALQDGLLWRDPLVQINPNFAPGKDIDSLVAEGLLHPECGRIFRRAKKETNGAGYPLNLHLHQEEAIRLGAPGKITFSVPAPDRANHFRTLFRSLTMSSGRGPRRESEPSLFIR